MPHQKARPRGRRRRRNWGRGIALALCLLFALIGIVPLALGVLVRTPSVREWAAEETARILDRELGVAAHYHVEMEAWPLSIALKDLVVDSNDGGSPFLAVEKASVRPRLFSLLAGELDVGDVEIVGPRIRAVVRDGEIVNVDYTLPETEPSTDDEPTATPLAALTITDARIDLDVDGVLVAAREVDVDLTAEPEQAFELAARAGTSSVTRARPFFGRESLEDAVDDDVLCDFETRVRIDSQGVLVRRLDLGAVVDFDPDVATPPSCGIPDEDWRHVRVRARALRVDPFSDRPSAKGHVHLRTPIAVAHRFAELPHATGTVELDLRVDHDGFSKLPHVEGQIELIKAGIDGKVFSDRLTGELSVGGEVVRLDGVVAKWSDGTIRISYAELQPFEPGLPLSAGPIDIEGVEFPGLLRDLGTHPRAHVAWTLESGHYDFLRGTLIPLELKGPLSVNTRDFAVYDRPTDDPQRRRMVGHAGGNVRGEFQILPHAVVLSNFTVATAKSRVHTTVSIGFEEQLGLDVFEGSVVDFSELSPLVAVPIAGRVHVTAGGGGPFDHPVLTGDVKIDDFSLGGFDVGDIERASVSFEPLALTLDDAVVRHDESVLRAPQAVIDFDGGADVLVDATIDTNAPSKLHLQDFFEVFKMDTDPRFAEMAGVAHGTATVRYALGGPQDRCGGGYIDVLASAHVEQPTLFGERYDDGDVDAHFIWDDLDAGDAGLRIDVRSLALRKGPGSIVAQVAVAHGAKLSGNAVATGIPMSKLDALGALGPMLDGSVSAVGNLSGTLSAIEGQLDVNLSPIRIGPGSLPASRFTVALEPIARAAPQAGITSCGNRRGTPFDRAAYDRDLSDGVFRARGELFGGQVVLEDVTISQQRNKVVAGTLRTQRLDLGILANLIPGVAYSRNAPTGHVSLQLDIDQYPLSLPQRTAATAKIDELRVDRSGVELSLTRPSDTITLADGKLTLPDLAMVARTKAGLAVTFGANGAVQSLMTNPDFDVGIQVLPLDLSQLSRDVASLEDVEGRVEAKLSVTGPVDGLRYTGHASLRNGAFAVKGFPLDVDDMDVDVRIAGGDIRITRATAKVGGGTIQATGRVPVRGLSLGTATADITARGIRVPIADGIDLTADGDLEATYRGADTAGEGQNLPELNGTISLTNFSYTRPIVMSVDLDQLTGGKKRTEVEAYDPANDAIRFNVNVVSPRALRFENNLVQMKLVVSDPGLTLSGTNQRFGARGRLKILPDSKIQIRAHEFDVTEGSVYFDDLTKMAPRVEARAETEYRRYASSAAAEPDASAGGDPAGSTTSGYWRIVLHAHGDAENLELDMTSDPPLAQEDILLLLTVGMTRAEVDRSLASSLGESVGLEALSTLTGADRAISDAVPLIDHFSFGSNYSSRSGRTEPNVTIGKRLTEDVRANVTTTLTESDVASSLEWRLRKGVSVEGSYDNTNDANSEGIGNIGADLRWRLEFE